MVFVTNSRTSHGRTMAFGLLDRSTVDVRESIKHALDKCRRQKRRLAKPVVGKTEFPLKRLRSNLAHAMSLDVIFQPTVGFYPEVKRPKLKNFGNNPVWDNAPSGAYYKARRLCSLLQPIVTHGYDANIVPDLVRLSINVWRMSKRHFDGLLHRIAARIAAHAKRAFLPNKSPEAEEGFVALSSNPVLRNRVHWYSRCQIHYLTGRNVALRLSKKLELVQKALWRSHLGPLRGQMFTRKG